MSSQKQTLARRSHATQLEYNLADVNELVEYVLTNHLIGGRREEIPLDKSLVEVGILDSYEIIELVDFIERRWAIEIKDREVTKENMGSIYRMAAFIKRKLTA